MEPSDASGTAPAPVPAPVSAEGSSVQRARAALARELNLARLHRLGVEAARRYDGQKSLKLHLGCGRQYKAGFVNVDLKPGVDLMLDLREPLPFQDGSCALIYSEHFFEHIDYPDGVTTFLARCLRVLEPGGEFSLGVPDAGEPLTIYAEDRDAESPDQAKWGARWHPAWCVTAMEHINYLFRQRNEHQWAYDFVTLRKVLHQAGFVDIVRRDFDPQLDGRNRRDGTLYMSGRKPG